MRPLLEYASAVSGHLIVLQTYEKLNQCSAVLLKGFWTLQYTNVQLLFEI